MNRRKGIIGFLAFAAAPLGLGQNKYGQVLYNPELIPHPKLLLSLTAYGDDDPVLEIQDGGRTIQLFKRDIMEAFEPPKPRESKP